jgi:prephenate dehydrogenase/prephenate dehydratase
MTRRSVGIIGFGQFGRFWAGVLSKDFDVYVSDKRDITAAAASIGVKAVSLEELCARTDSIFLCVPINLIENAALELKPYIRPGMVIFDTCSVKTYPVQVLHQQFAGCEVELIATHPMFGPDSAKNGLTGLAFVIWPLQVSDTTYHAWFDYFIYRELRVVEMSPDEHDRLAANSQGITHYIGRVLERMNLQETPIDTAGFKVLRAVVGQTCNDTWELFHDLQYHNHYTKEMRLQLETAMDDVYEQLLPKQISPHELVIGIQGGRGSNSEVACRQYCATHGINRYRIEYLYTSRQVLSALHRGETDRGVFAIQNARGGVVLETVVALSEFSCEILEIFDIVVDHCLLHHPDVRFDAVDTIISHPQAFAQCESTLKARYPYLKLISGEGDLIDQAFCAQNIAEGKLPSTMAVLATCSCADLFGLTIHDIGLQDLGANNLTTFVWVERRKHFH